MKTRAWMGWGAVLVVGSLVGGWLAVGRAGQGGGGGLLPIHQAALAIDVTPEQPFELDVATSAEGPARRFDGAQPLQLAPGDYFIVILPVSPDFLSKRLKVHLEPNMRLALPVTLSRARPEPPPTAVPPAASAEAPSSEAPTVEVVPFADPDAPESPAAEPSAELAPRHPGVLFDRLIAAPGAPKADLVIRGRVADARPMVSGAGVDADALARYVRSRKAAIQGCYERALKQNPKLKGTVRVRFTITRMGRSSEISLEGDTIVNDAVGSCIKSIIRGWVFPFKPENDVQVIYPFAFSPASR